MQPKLPRRKQKLREHRKMRKMKAKGLRVTEDGAPHIDNLLEAVSCHVRLNLAVP